MARGYIDARSIVREHLFQNPGDDLLGRAYWALSHSIFNAERIIKEYEDESNSD